MSVDGEVFVQTQEENIEVIELPDESDSDAYNEFIDRHRKFILRVTSKTLNRFVTESDDAYAVALVAFTEAMRRYDESKGSFYGFAGLVIRRRVLDYLKTEYRMRREIDVEPVTFTGDAPDTDTAEDSVNAAVSRKAIDQSMEQVGAYAPGTTPVADEIAAMQDILAEYGFSFFDITDASPRSEKTKLMCRDIIRYIHADEEMIAEMRRKRMLPAAEIIKELRIPRKKIERHRRYIIAVLEILNGDFPQLQEYFRSIKEQQ